MNKIPHFRVPLSLFDDPIFYDARWEHQCIFLMFIRLAAYKPVEHDIRGFKIIIQPGQLCYSLLKLADLGGKHCTIGQIRGTLKYFAKNRYLTQKVTHQKSIITITHADTYKLLLNLPNTTSNTPINTPLTRKDSTSSTSIDVEKTLSKKTVLFSSRQAETKQPMQHNVYSQSNPFKLSEVQLETLSWLKSQAIDTEDNTLSYWAKTYSQQRLKDVYDTASKQSDSSLGAYMQKLLKKNAYVETELTKSNQKYALSFKESNTWNQLKIGDKYVTCLMPGGYEKEIGLNYNSQVFQSCLHELYQSFKSLIEA